MMGKKGLFVYLGAGRPNTRLGVLRPIFTGYATLTGEVAVWIPTISVLHDRHSVTLGTLPALFSESL